MKRTWVTICILVFFVCGNMAKADIAEQEAEAWAELYICAARYLPDIAVVVESLQEGTDLLVDVLCVEESANVGNAMARARVEVVAQYSSYSEAFSSFIIVIKRDVMKVLYFQKLKLQ